MFWIVSTILSIFVLSSMFALLCQYDETLKQYIITGIKTAANKIIMLVKIQEKENILTEDNSSCQEEKYETDQ